MTNGGTEKKCQFKSRAHGFYFWNFDIGFLLIFAIGHWSLISWLQKGGLEWWSIEVSGKQWLWLICHFHYSSTPLLQCFPIPLQFTGFGCAFSQADLLTRLAWFRNTNVPFLFPTTMSGCFLF